MDFEMYWRLRQSLYYDHSKDMTDKMRLLEELPLNLRVGHHLEERFISDRSGIQERNHRVVPQLQ